jgi:hypothetical protein
MEFICIPLIGNNLTTIPKNSQFQNTFLNITVASNIGVTILRVTILVLESGVVVVKGREAWRRMGSGVVTPSHTWFCLIRADRRSPSYC